MWSTAFTKDCFREEDARAVKRQLIPEGDDMRAALYLGHAAKKPEPRKPCREDVVSYL